MFFESNGYFADSIGVIGYFKFALEISALDFDCKDSRFFEIIVFRFIIDYRKSVTQN